MSKWILELKNKRLDIIIAERDSRESIAASGSAGGGARRLSKQKQAWRVSHCRRAGNRKLAFARAQSAQSSLFPFFFSFSLCDYV